MTLGTSLGFARELAVANLVAAIERSYDPDNARDFTALIDHTMAYGVTAAAIAKGLNVSQGTVSRWRSGRSRPTLHYREAAAAVCIAELIAWEPVKPP